MNNGDMPAGPVTYDSMDCRPSFEGLTKREMMSMHILSALLSIPVHDSYGSYLFNSTPEEAARAAIKHADALLKGLEK